MVENGDDLPPKEEVQIGSGKLLSKRRAATASANPNKKRHKFAPLMESDEEESTPGPATPPTQAAPNEVPSKESQNPLFTPEVPAEQASITTPLEPNATLLRF